MAELADDGRTHRALADGSRRRVLRLLREEPDGLDVREVATRIGVHVSTAREHLERLVDAGFAIAAPQRHGGRGRPRRLYRPAPDAPLTAEADRYRFLAAALASQIAASDDAAAASVAAGERWGRALAASDAGGTVTGRAAAQAKLILLLDDLGFHGEPEDNAVRLRHCPFLAVARDRPQVVCNVHLGLLRGALAAWGAPVTVDELAPALDPIRCVARLGATAAATDPLVAANPS